MGLTHHDGRRPRACRRSKGPHRRHGATVWALHKVTPLQAEYIKMFYGADVLHALQHQPSEAHATA